MSLFRLAPFLIGLFGIVGLANVYVLGRVATTLGIGRSRKRIAALALALLLLVFIGSRALEQRIPDVLAAFLSGVSWNAELALVVAAGAILVVDLVWGASALGGMALRRLRAKGPAPEESTGDTSGPPEPLATRRTFLAQAAMGSAVVASGGYVGYAGLFGRHDYVLEEVGVRVPGLSPKLDGLTIAQLSDVHIGLHVGERELAAAIDLVRRAKPDLVVLTGDLVDHDARFAPQFGAFVRRLSELARYGAFVIPGNHDYYTGVDAVLDAAARGGATVLRNDARLVGDGGVEIALVGVDDVQGRPDFAHATRLVPPDRPRVLLAHNPVYFPTVAGQVALQLSGHTHGGQINLGVSPAALLLPFGYVAGRYERAGSTLYVNRGFGTAGPPARMGAPPEVSRIVLAAG